MTSFSNLPTDLHLVILSYLSVLELARLAQTCRFLHTLVAEHGWSTHRRHNLDDTISPSMRAVYPHWSDQQRVVHAHISERNWQQRAALGQAISTRWSAVPQPVLAACSERLVVLSGASLFSFRFNPPRRHDIAPSAIRLETRFVGPPSVERDVAGAAFIPDHGHSRTLIVALHDGTVERLRLTSDDKVPPHHPSRVVRTATYDRAPRKVHALAASGNTVAVVSRTGQVALYRANAPWEAPTTATLPCNTRRSRTWTAYLPPSTPTPSFAAFGRAHADAVLTVHPLRPDAGLDETYTTSLPGAAPHSRGHAVYAIAPMTGSHPDMLLSGWFDGRARAYDLRLPSTEGAVLTLHDPWIPDALFSVACAGYRVAAGTARHGMVALFDIRFPRAGWSVYPPASRGAGAENGYSSPVYGLAVEEARVFAVTRKTVFALDFSAAAGRDTFPVVPGETVSHQLTKYDHIKGR